MQVWILGAGALGIHVAEQLRRELHDVVIIERNRARADAALREIDCMVEIADGTNLAALRRLSIEQADCFIAVTQSDEVNMVACGLVANAFHIPVKIARVRSMNYASGISDAPELFGIDHVISPEVETARAILRSIEHGAVGEVVPFENTSYSLKDIRVHAHSLIAGMTLARMRSECEEPFLVPLIQREGEYLVPDGSTQVEAGDTLYLFSGEAAYRTFFEAIDRRAVYQTNRILILGGTLIGTTIAESLSDPKRLRGERGNLERVGHRLLQSFARRVTIVERDPARCEELAHHIPGIRIIPADIRDERRITRADYQKHDLIVGATADQESNMISALYAKSMGTPRAAAVLFHDGYTRIARSLGIDVPVSLKASMVNAISSVLRGKTVRIIHSVPGSGLSLVRMRVTEASPMAGTAIMRGALPKHTLIMSIRRGEREFLPSGKDHIESGDELFIMARTADISRLAKAAAPDGEGA